MTKTTVTITVPGRVYLDALDPNCSDMQADLGLGRPTRWRTVGKGDQAVWEDLNIEIAADLADYLFDRGFYPGFTPDDSRERELLSALVKTAQKIRAEIRAVLAAEEETVR